MAENWWGTLESASPRMSYEILQMKQHFNPQKPTLITPKVRWDTAYLIITWERRLIIIDRRPDHWALKIQLVVHDDTRQLAKRLHQCWSATEEQRVQTQFWAQFPAYEMQVRYTQGYPASEARTQLISPRLSTNAPHRFGDGTLCVHNHSGPRTGWDPARSTAATMALWSTEWIRAWRHWERNGDWPTGG